MVTAQHTLETIASSEEGKVKIWVGTTIKSVCGLTEKYKQGWKRAKFADNLIGH